MDSVPVAYRIGHEQKAVTEKEYCTGTAPGLTR